MALVRFIAALFSRFKRLSSPSSESGENEAIRLGRLGERLAARHLRRVGYKILYRNFRAPHGGEVDLVCRDKTCNTLAFVEVKTRRSLAYGDPSESVTREKQKLIARGAMTWLAMLDHPQIYIRFDIVEIVFGENGPEYNVIKEAFQPPEHYRF